MSDRAAMFFLLVSSLLSTQGVLAAEKPTTQPAVKTVEKAHPGLASGVLTYAMLTRLPEGTLLQSGEICLTEADLAAELKSAPSRMQEQLKKNAFFMLEQMATRKLLLEMARGKAAKNKTDTSGKSEDDIMKAYLDGLAKAVAVSDAEVKEFYEKNKDMCGGAKLNQIKDQLSQYVLQQKQQEAVNEHIRTLGKRLSIEVSAKWTDRQAVLAKDNPVDKARSSGKPSVVDFGAVGCRACDMMTPILESLSKKYEGKANVLFVHVRNEPVLAARYGVRGIPTQVLFDKAGKEVFRHAGFYPQIEIEKHLANMGAK